MAVSFFSFLSSCWRKSCGFANGVKITRLDIAGFDQLRDESLGGTAGENSGQHLSHATQDGRLWGGGGVIKCFALEIAFYMAFLDEIDQDRSEGAVID